MLTCPKILRSALETQGPARVPFRASRLSARKLLTASTAGTHFPGLTVYVVLQVMDEFAYGLIKKRKCTAYTTSDDALSRFMKMEDKNGKQLLSDKELRDIVLGLLLAGR